ncbi:MAG: exopolysaccharide biosynthesis protein [Candidatus Paracaedibacteraceae bacterium]|nr:exopolysaccharide biosynthesis protein [Candidatus Paracaedibacteraceae bacterium]
MSKKTVTQLIEEYIYIHQASHISVEGLIQSLRERGYGLLLLLLALPNVLLLTSIPGTSTFFGIPICLIAFQLIMNRPQPWLPDRIRHRYIERETLLTILRKASPYLLKIEHYVRPRWMRMTHKRMEQLMGFFILALGIIIALPIPFGNFLGGVGVAIFSLALIEKDGVFALVGMVLTLLISFVIFKVAGSIIVFLESIF